MAKKQMNCMGKMYSVNGLLRQGRKTLLTLSATMMCVAASWGQAGTWTAMATTAPHYNSGEMELLTDGTVLCKTSSGGTSYGTRWDRLTPDATGSYVNGTWTTITAMNNERLYFSTQVLPDGRLYVAGGEYGVGGKYSEVYSPKTNAWTACPPMRPGPYSFTISDANSELLNTGKVLQAVVDTGGTRLNFLWDPASNTYASTASCLRTDNEAVWVKLPDNSVVFIDNYSTTSERYIPATNTWINDGTLPVDLYDPYGSEAGAGYLLPNGKVFFIGSTPTTAYYTPTGTTSPGTWAAGPAIPKSQGEPDAASSMMPNGHILMTLSPTPVAGDNFPDTTAWYEFDYTTNTYTHILSPWGDSIENMATYITNMLVLPDGSIMYGTQGDNQYFVYAPGSAPVASGKPTLDTIIRNNCDTFTATGTLFNGISEGAAYGDDWQMSTNYPIFRLTSGTNVYYATSYNWNRIGAVATGAALDTAIFVIPSGLPTGTYSVQVIANGIPSSSYTLNTSLAVSPSTTTLCSGYTQAYTDASNGGTWSSSSAAVGTIDPATGIFTAIGPGTATITYTVGTCTGTATVNVSAAPSAISGSSNICTGQVILFGDTSPSGSWSSSASGVASVDGSGNVTGSTVGTANISYTVGSCAAIMPVTVNASPAAVISPSGTVIICSGSSTVLNANVGAGLTYQWQESGSAISGATTDTYTAGGSGGNYTVYETNTAGCNTTSATTTVSIGTPPTSIATAAGPTTFCSGSSVNINATTFAGYSYQWQVGGSNIAGATATTYNATATGNYTLLVTNTALCTSTSTTVSVDVIPAPTAAITPVGSTTFCLPGSVVLDATTGSGYTYQWQKDGSAIAGAAGSTYTATVTGAYTVAVSNGACSATSAGVNVNANSAIIGPISGGSSVCVGQTLSLTDTSSGGVWHASSGDVSITTGGVVTGLTADTVTITYSAATSCGSGAATLVVTINPLPTVPAIGGVTSVCSGGTTTLTDATGGGTWSSGTAVVAGVSTGGVVTGSSVGTANISYTLTSSYGCVASAVAPVTVFAPFTVSLSTSGSTSFCTGGYVVLSNTGTGSGITGYQWQVGGVNIPGATSDSYTASSTGNYELVVTGSGGCFASSSPVAVTVSSSPIIIPAVVISASPGTTICSSSTMVTYTALPVNGGSSPSLDWFVNGSFVGVGATYSYTPASGDIVKCDMTSSAACAFPATAEGSVTMTISGMVAPSVSVSANPGFILCSEIADTLTAIPVFGGTTPSYIWSRNGINVATGPTYYTTFSNGDVVVCKMTSDYPCVTTTAATSPSYVMHVDPPTANTVTIHVSQSSILEGAVDSFVAVAPNGGSSPVYQWLDDGSPIAGATNAIYVTRTLVPGEIISCRVTSSDPCATPNTATSGGVRVAVIPTGVAQVSGGNDKFMLVPNPNQGAFTISGTLADGIDDDVTVVVTDLLGQQIYTGGGKAHNGTVSERVELASSIANGTYLVSVTSGSEHVVFHVVVNR
jgi:Kelch motif/Bacterial Ig-like domain (group 2)